ncbi:MAG: hypothetical protein ACRD0U_00395 [Acidimicrobiales bacterium]
MPAPAQMASLPLPALIVSAAAEPRMMSVRDHTAEDGEIVDER